MFFVGTATRHGGQGMRRCYSGMFETSSANLIGGFVFGSIGFVAFIYGKRMNLWKPMFLGIGLMIYPYFVSNDVVMCVIGILGSTALFFLRD